MTEDASARACHIGGLTFVQHNDVVRAIHAAEEEACRQGRECERAVAEAHLLTIRGLEAEIERLQITRTLERINPLLTTLPETDIARLEREAGRAAHAHLKDTFIWHKYPVRATPEELALNKAVRALDAAYARQRDGDGWNNIRRDLDTHLNITIVGNDNLVEWLKQRCTLKGDP